MMFSSNMFDCFDNDFSDGYLTNEPTHYSNDYSFDQAEFSEPDGVYLLYGAKGGVIPLVHGGDLSHVCYANDYFSIIGNAHDLLAMQNPLAHASEYHCNPFDITNGEGVNHELVYVDGYLRDDGTYVRIHFRTAPDGIEENNISYWKG